MISIYKIIVCINFYKNHMRIKPKSQVFKNTAK